MTESRQFLEALFGDSDKHFLLWTLQDQLSYWFTDVDKAESKVRELAGKKRDVYVGCGLAPADMGMDHRCKAGEIAGIVGLWADIDIADAVHSKSNLPPDAEAAIWLAEGVGLKPSVVVSSGHGLHVWWLFNEPWVFESEDDRKDAQVLVASWGATLRAKARSKGWVIDSVFDLSRILRVPGTMNLKTPDDPRPVSVLSLDPELRYNPGDFDRYLVDCNAVEGASKYYETVGALKLSADAEPPAEKFHIMCQNSEKFAPTWERQRPELNNDQSAYDQSLANMAAEGGWDDQEITNLLIAHRRRGGGETKLRLDYYQRTIAEARRWLDQMKARESAGAIRIDDMLESVKSASEEDKPRKRDELLDFLSNRIGARIVRFVKYGTEPPQYDLVTDRGTVRFCGIEPLGSKVKFVNALAQTLDYFIDDPKKEWNSMRNALMACLEHENVGDEATRNGQLRQWLREYLEERQPQDDPLDERDRPYVDEEGVVWIAFGNFWGWLTGIRKEKVDRSSIISGLSSIGAVYRHRSFRRPGSGKTSSKRKWCLEKVDME